LLIRGLLLMKLSTFSVQLPPEKIGFLKFILEAYDGLAIMSTRDSKAGIVDIYFPKELHGDVRALVASITSNLSKKDKN